MLMANNPHTSDDRDELDFNLDLLGIVRRRYLHIMLGTFVGVTAAVVYFLNQVPIYQSGMAILIGQRQSKVTSTGMGGAEAESALQDSLLSTHVELIRSPKILQEAVVTGKLPLTAGELYGGLEVSKGGSGVAKTASILTATFKAKDPELAAKVLTALFDAYQKYIDEKSQSVGATAAELIAKSLVEVDVELKRSSKEYYDYIATIPALISSAQSDDSLQNIHATRLQGLEAELSTVRQNIAQLRSRVSNIQEFAKGKSPESVSEMDVLTLMNEAEIGRLRSMFSVSSDGGYNPEFDQALQASRANMQIEYQHMLELESRRKKLEATVGTSHTSYIAVLREIASIKDFIAQKQKEYEAPETAKLISPAEMLSTYNKIITTELRENEAREKELVQLANVESKAAKEVEGMFVASRALRTTMNRAQQRYDEIFKRLQEINLSNEYSGFSTDLIVPPVAASVPVWPSKMKIIVLGILAGGMLGLGLAMLAEMTDRTFRDPHDVEQSLGAAILAHVPRLVPPTAKHIAANPAIAKSEVSVMINTLHLPRGGVAEIFRSMRTAILLMSKKDNRRIIMVTSPSPGDGKSTSIGNLAVSLAQSGKRVLLVDADLRRPVQAKMFGLKGRAGLVDFLRSKASLDEVCHETEQKSLWLCPDGTPTSQPSELLGSDALNDFIRQARAKFDIVLFDAPPVLAVTDPKILADVCDTILMVIRVEKNNRSLVERAKAILAEQGAVIDGVVVNSRNKTRSGAYAYSSFHYYSGKEYGLVAKYQRDYAVSDSVRLREREEAAPIKANSSIRNGAARTE